MASLYDLCRYREIAWIMLSVLPLPVHAVHCKDAACNSHTNNIIEFHNATISDCMSTANTCLPKQKKKTAIAGWNELVCPLQEDVVFWHYVWQSNGCRKTGSVFEIHRSTRAQYQ